MISGVDGQVWLSLLQINTWAFPDICNALIMCTIVAQRRAWQCCQTQIRFPMGYFHVSSDRGGGGQGGTVWVGGWHISSPCFGSKQWGKVKKLLSFVRVPVVMILPPTLETKSNCRFIVGVESEIPALATLFSLSGPGIWDLKSPSVSDVSTGKLSSGTEVFSDAAQTQATGMKVACHKVSVCSTRERVQHSKCLMRASGPARKINHPWLQS